MSERTRSSIFLALLLVLVPSSGYGQDQDPDPSEETQEQEDRDPHQLAPPVDRGELIPLARAARERGFAYLLTCQNFDGSWGSHDPQVASLKDFGFQLKNRGSQDGVRLACTAICAHALMDQPERSEAEELVFQKAIVALSGTEKFAAHKGELFNTWGYGYKLDFLTRYLQTPEGARRRKEIEPAAKVCIEGLARHQRVDGGWNYYGGLTGDGESMSFTTASFVIALLRAQEVGLDVPAGLAEDGAKLLARMRTVKGGFIYDARFLLEPSSVNELSAGSRTVVCALALDDADLFTSAQRVRSMEVFYEGENYLEDGRKLLQPHTAVHQISGNFFFYGYNYATELAERMGDEVSLEHWDRLAWTMIRTQEENGCWWDTAAADYGDKWGTGFALLTLGRYLDEVERRGTPEEDENDDE